MMSSENMKDYEASIAHGIFLRNAIMEQKMVAMYVYLLFAAHLWHVAMAYILDALLFR